MTAILFLTILAITSVVVWRMWQTGRISAPGPQTREDRIRLFWLVLGVANFLAFIVHVMNDGTCAFPGGGRLVGGHYLVSSHGHDISFTPAGYALSYWHGVVFVGVHLVCMIAGWRVRGTGESKGGSRRE